MWFIIQIGYVLNLSQFTIELLIHQNITNLTCQKILNYFEILNCLINRIYDIRPIPKNNENNVCTILTKTIIFKISNEYILYLSLLDIII